MRPRILVTASIHDEVAERLAAVGELTINPRENAWTHEEVELRARESDVMMAFMTDRLQASFFASPGRLRMVACALKGYDNFDVGAAVRAGVRMSIVPDLLTEPTAELAIGLAIGLARNIRPGDLNVRDGRFLGWRPILYGAGLRGSTAAVIGLGKVGRSIVDCLQGFGCGRLLGFDPAASDARTHDSTLEAIAAQADFVFVAAPLNRATRHLISVDYLALAKPSQFIVNIGRGSVVDEDAVAEALQSGRLGGYAADVFAFEDWALDGRPSGIPPQLLSHPSTLFTPHLGSAVKKVRLEIEQRAANNILAFLAGRAPPDEISA